MIRQTFSVLIACSLLALGMSAQTIATLPDGSKILVKADGTWEKVADTSATKPAANRDMAKIIPDDPKQTYAALDRISAKLKKDEFETEQQYLARLAAIAKETRVPTAASRTLADTVFLFHDLASYDAESQAFILNLYKINDSARRPTLTPYSAPETQYLIRLVEFKTGYWEPQDVLMIWPKIPMPAAEAMKVKPQLAVAVYGMPVGSSCVGSYRCTVDLAASRMVAFNQTTGEVYYEATFKALTDSPLFK